MESRRGGGVKMQIKSISFSHRGGRRKHNEDALLEKPCDGVWVVADGMGGYQAGDVASGLVCDTVAEAIKQSRNGLSPADLERALYRANDRIRQYGEDRLEGQTLGSTVVALLVESDRYHLFWAGDSRCYLSRNGHFDQLSRDHSQVAEMVHQGLLRPDEAESHPLAHVITRALGVDAQVTLDYETGRVRAGDTIMLCSDGVSKEFSHLELGAFMSGDQINDASLAIMHSALVKECNDNISCIIVKLSNRCYFYEEPEQIEDPTVPVKPRSCDKS